MESHETADRPNRVACDSSFLTHKKITIDYFYSINYFNQVEIGLIINVVP